MILKANVREKLERIVELTDARADAEIVKVESVMGSGHGSFAVVGFAIGARFVRDMILTEFDFLFSNDEEDNQQSGADWLMNQAGSFDSEDVTEMTLKQRLENVANDIEDQAAVKLKAAFPELFEEQISDEPIEPFHYIDSNKILFRDACDRHYFWDELYQYAHGPYSSNVEACEALRKYGQELEGGE